MAGRRTYHARACVLDRTKLGETDLILTLLGSNGAQLRAVAKGARKPGGKLAGKVQLFCECDLLLACGKNLDVVAEAVERFDENGVIMTTSAGTLIVTGEDLHIGKLSLDGGELLVEGHIDGLNFEDAPVRKSSFFSRLLG